MHVCARSVLVPFAFTSASTNGQPRMCEVASRVLLSCWCYWHDSGRCEDCRGHFLDMYEARSNGRGNIPQANGIRGGQHPDEGEAALALWVWRMHNAVNTRLALDEGGQDRADK